MGRSCQPEASALNPIVRLRAGRACVGVRKCVAVKGVRANMAATVIKAANLHLRWKSAFGFERFIFVFSTSLFLHHRVVLKHLMHVLNIFDRRGRNSPGKVKRRLRVCLFLVPYKGRKQVRDKLMPEEDESQLAGAKARCPFSLYFCYKLSL